MTTVTAAETGDRPGGPTPILASVVTITARNLRRLVRVPTLLVFATVQPVLFVLLFTYAFGGAIHVPPAPDPPRLARNSSRQMLTEGVQGICCR